ncbi:MAG: hypothetical protein JSW72_05435 [Candidatus Bathyarchaeota archaeon]|nr:MAG: hypothetical protein JSW72_05435 [Candidatus Bathyarchaeota archaeon]
MYVKKPIALAAVLTLIVTGLSVCTIAYSQAEERRVWHSLDWGVFLIEITAPVQAWPGDPLNITIMSKASTEIHVEFIRASLSCLKENLTETPIGTIDFLKNATFSPEETSKQHYEVTLPKDALPGLIYGKLQYSWYIQGDIQTSFEDVEAFRVTFVQNKAYEELRQAYDALNSFAEDLQANYTSLEANYTDFLQQYQQLADTQIMQNNATGLMYLFIVTTGVFVVTTILLMVRRPKTAW